MDTSNRLMAGDQDQHQDLDKFEFVPDQKSLLLKTRLAVGFLVAGALSFVKDVLTASGGRADVADDEDDLAPLEDWGVRSDADEDFGRASAKNDGSKKPANKTDSGQDDAPSAGKHKVAQDNPRDDRADFEPQGESAQVAMAPLQPIVPDAGNDNDLRLPSDFRYQNLSIPAGQSASGAIAAKNQLEASDILLVDKADIDPYDASGPESDDSLVDSAGRTQLRNRAPNVSGPVVLDGLLVNQSVLIGLSSLLVHASDADGDTLSVENLTASSGQLQALGDGRWMFTPELNDTSEVVFSYVVSDGEAGVSQTALLDLLPQPASEQLPQGTDGDDQILGTSEADIIDAKAGDDIVIALHGNDTIFGGAGDDVILGGEGDDLILGGAGNDTIFGDGGDDRIFAGSGDDVVWGGEGADIIFGQSGNDILYGEAGIDLIFGGEGADKIDGGGGDDRLAGDGGADSVSGGAGDDRILASVNDGDDQYDGGSGSDSYDLSATTADATVDLSAGSASSAQTGRDQLRGIENVVGSAGDDAITGDEQDNKLHGEDGDDRLHGGDGDDRLHGGDGDDRLYGDDGDDRLHGDDGDDKIDGGDGDDRIDGGDGDDEISGGNAVSYDDITVGNGGSLGQFVVDGGQSSSLEGHDGDDLIIGGGGNDLALGGGDDDTFVATVNDGNDYYDGESGDDTYSLHLTNAAATVDLKAGTATSAEIGNDILHSIEHIVGSNGDDIIIANEDMNVLTGGGGSDTFVFESVADAGLGEGHRDRIVDFRPGDRIDLSQIDAHCDSDENEDFELLASRGEELVIGKINYRYDFFDGEEHTIIEGDTDGDQEADFEIEVAGHHIFRIEDFDGVY